MDNRICSLENIFSLFNMSIKFFEITYKCNDLKIMLKIIIILIILIILSLNIYYISYK
jgi:hypothetical protein